MASTTVQRIENDIAALSEDELQQLFAWLEKHRPQPIDQRIEVDANAGRLDRVVLEALQDADQGHLRRL